MTFKLLWMNVVPYNIREYASKMRVPISCREMVPADTGGVKYAIFK